MRFVQKNGNGPSDVKGTAEFNQHIDGEKRGGRGGIAGEGQGLSEEDELRIIDDGEDANSRRSLSSVQLPVETGQPHGQVQSQSQVCWDRFLPVGSPKVLLVESDDSTRHIVTALLRNCSYEGELLSPNYLIYFNTYSCERQSLCETHFIYGLNSPTNTIISI